MTDDGVRYEFKSAKVVRGTEARTIAKWAKLGWELDTQMPGRLRTEVTFRRRKKRMSKGLLLGIVAFGSLAVIGGIAFVIAGGGDAEPGPTSAPSAGSSSADVPGETPSAIPAPDETAEGPKELEPTADTYSYEGPRYEIVTVDEDQGPAKLTQYWVTTNDFDYSTDAYREPVKLLIADVARTQGTAELIVQVVSDKEIALAESPSTYKAFIREHGMDYAINKIPSKEKEGWVASYTGGFNYSSGKASDSAAAFEVLWRPYATAEVENWKPETAG